MLSPAFAAGSVGIVLETLLSDPVSCNAGEFEKIVQACARAGFRSVSLWGTHAAAMGIRTARAILDRAEVRAQVVEFPTGWADGPEAAVTDLEELLDQVGTLGAHTLLAVARNATIDHPRAVEGFAALCDRAATRGLKIAIEFIPCRAVADLATAWRIVRESGASNSGIVLDTMHFQNQRGGPQLDVLRSIPGHHIHVVQLCDAAPPPPPLAGDYITMALTARLVPGEGVVDFPVTLAALADIGAEPLFVMEVFNSALAAKGPDAMAEHLHGVAEGLLK